MNNLTPYELPASQNQPPGRLWATSAVRKQRVTELYLDGNPLLHACLETVTRGHHEQTRLWRWR